MSDYRDKLVSLIKASGQELIDRAETLVDEDLSMICDATIILSFPCNGLPKMEITTEVVNKKAIDFLTSNSK